MKKITRCYLTKKERLLVEEYKVRYRFETAKTFNETMNAVIYASNFASLYNKSLKSIINKYQNQFIQKMLDKEIITEYHGDYIVSKPSYVGIQEKRNGL